MFRNQNGFSFIMNDHVWKLCRSDGCFNYSKCVKCGIYKAQNKAKEIDLDDPPHIWWSRNDFYGPCVCVENEDCIPACSEESMEQAIG